MTRQRIGISDQLLELIRKAVEWGFQSETSLRDVCDYVKEQLEIIDCGKWLCIIRPSACTGFRFSKVEQKSVQFKLKINEIQYNITVAKTRNKVDARFLTPDNIRMIENFI